VVQQIEHHEQRRRGDGVGVRLAEPFKPGPELLIVDGYLAVQHERAGGQLRDGRRDVREAVASGQIKLRRIDGWRKIATVLSQHPTVAA
jgi:hypothetical protein